MHSNCLRASRALAPLAILVSIGGCGGHPGRMAPPDIDPAGAAAAALQQLDKNSDGGLDDAELREAPGLAAAKARYDADSNSSLSEEEVANGIRRWAEGKMGAISVPFMVRLNGRPLDDAQVRLIPEPFLGDAAKAAIGEIRRGSGYLTIAPEDRPANAPNIPLILPGLYRVEISHPTANIPSDYNSSSTLGVEIAQDTVSNEGIIWNLTSR